MTGGSGPGITRPRGQQLARRELARTIYRPSLLTRLWHDIERWLSSLVSGQSAGSPSWWGLILLAVVLLAALAAVVFWLGPTRVNRQVRDRPVLAAKPRGAADYRAEAERLATVGDYRAAIIERLRAITIDLEAREILLPIPARTAMELAVEAGGAFPAEAASLASAARIFDDVRYGGRTGTERGYDRIRSLDLRLRAAHASPTTPTGPGTGPTGLPPAGPLLSSTVVSSTVVSSTVVSGPDQPSGRVP
jgi:hypothetical protein